MEENGLVTRSDVLLADVRAGQVDAQLLAARGQAALARRQLALLLGAPADTSFTLPPTFRLRNRLAAGPTPSWVRRRRTPQPGPMWKPPGSASVAADRDAARARARLLPRLNAFGRYDWNSGAGFYQGDRSWTVGLMMNWMPFSGGAELADGRAARGRRENARAMAEAALGRRRSIWPGGGPICM